MQKAGMTALSRTVLVRSTVEAVQIEHSRLVINFFLVIYQENY